MHENISPEFLDLYRRPVSGPASFISQRVSTLYDWWLGFYPLMPSMADFDIVDHVDLAASLFLYKVREPGFMNTV